MTPHSSLEASERVDVYTCLLSVCHVKVTLSCFLWLPVRYRVLKLGRSWHFHERERNSCWVWRLHLFVNRNMHRQVYRDENVALQLYEYDQKQVLFISTRNQKYIFPQMLLSLRIKQELARWYCQIMGENKKNWRACFVVVISWMQVSIWLFLVWVVMPRDWKRDWRIHRHCSFIAMSSVRTIILLCRYGCK